MGVTVSTPFDFGICGLCMSYDIDILEECNDHCVNYGFEIICFLRRFLGIQGTLTDVMKETDKDAAKNRSYYKNSTMRP